MKKYEKLNKIINYVYKKKSFTLQDLITEFEVSKSTALRYISALEDIGLPLYSEKGRYGGYKLLDSYKLPPITFTPQETYAIFFAIKGVELLESIPFKAEFSKIKEKFLSSVPANVKDTLEKLYCHVSFGTVKVIEDSPLLEELLYAILDKSVIRITYKSKERVSIRRIQPIGIFADDEHWYCPSFDLDINEYRMFRCDRIQEITPLKDQPIEYLNNYDLYNRFDLVKKSPQAINYKIEISEDGKYIFEKNNYSNMSLEEIDDHFYIVGWIEPKGIKFLVNYMLKFGQSLVDISPSELKEKYIEQLHTMINKFGQTNKI